MKRGPYNNRKKEYKRARELRKQGYGYRIIGKEVGICWGTIRNWVADLPIDIKKAHRIASDKARITDIRLFKSKDALRRFLIRKRGRRCEECGLKEWNGKKIILEVEHKDGNKHNNNEKNLKLLCPNCHSLTPTWRRKKSSL